LVQSEFGRLLIALIVAAGIGKTDNLAFEALRLQQE